jgi:hypothetical protein
VGAGELRPVPGAAERRSTAYDALRPKLAALRAAVSGQRSI